MKEPENVVDVVTSSLVTVMKQSLNASFRKECQQLLGVTNNKEAQDIMRSLFARMIPKLEPQKESDLQASSSFVAQEERGNDGDVDIQLQFEANQKRDYISEAEHRMKSSTSSFPTADRCSHLATDIMAECTQKPQIKWKDTPSQEVDSDEETQLDWDEALI